MTPYFLISYAAGAVNITVRIGMPQLEQNAYATSVIATSSAAVTRAADVYNQQPASYFDGTGTLQFAAANVVRDTHNPASPYADLGNLIEPAATNSIRNNMMVGAVVADGVERTNNGTFSTSGSNVCSGSVTSGSNTLSCNNGSGTGWVGTINTGSGSVAAASGSMTLTGDNTNAGSIYQAITTVSGYYYTIAVTTGSGNAVTVQAGTGAGGRHRHHQLCADQQHQHDSRDRDDSFGAECGESAHKLGLEHRHHQKCCRPSSWNRHRKRYSVCRCAILRNQHGGRLLPCVCG
jgi:hypothetical protein